MVPLSEILEIKFLHIESEENGFLKVFPISVSKNLMSRQRSSEH